MTFPREEVISIRVKVLILKEKGDWRDQATTQLEERQAEHKKKENALN